MIANERLDEVVVGLTAALARECSGTVIDKEDSALHKVIAGGFDIAQSGREIAKDLVSVLSIDVPELGIPTGAKYMSDFATTIGNVVAIPRAWTPAQRLVTLPHEWAHIFQHQRGVDAGWWPRVTTHSVLYLCSVATKDAAEYLGHVEGDAYAVTECVLQFLTGQRRPVSERAENLRRHYALMNEGVVVATQTLESHYRTMDDGGVPNVTAARVALDYLRSEAMDIAGRVTL